MKNKKLFAILTLVCFMFTLMPMAAFAEDTQVPAANEETTENENSTTAPSTAPSISGINYQESSVLTEDVDASEETGAPVSIQFDFVDNDGKSVKNTSGNIYVWFVKDGANVAATAVTKDKATGTNGVFTIANPQSGVDYDFTFANSGTYTVKAALMDPNGVEEKTLAAKFANVDYKLQNVANQSKIEITSSTSSSKYLAKAEVDGNELKIQNAAELTASTVTGYYADGAEFGTVKVTATNVAEKEVTVKFVDKDGKAIKGESVTFETNSSNIELNKEKATTDQLGQVKFKITGVRDGNYKVYVNAGSYEAVVLVQVGSTKAQNIKCVKSPSAPIDVTSDLDDEIQFTFTDANGNAVLVSKASEEKAFIADNAYVSIVSQPAGAKLENKNLVLEPKTTNDNEYKAKLALTGLKKDLVEGTYEVKVVLDNGKSVTVSFEVKEFGTPVALNLSYDASSVELGSKVVIDTLEWVDANGVTKSAKGKVDLSASGYAVRNFVAKAGKDDYGVLTVKADEKYVGSTITVVAVDDRYNLTATATLTVADEATALVFDTKTLAVGTNNKVKVSVADSQGNAVALQREDASQSISYVVLDKPEGAKVSVTTDGADNKLLTEGTFVMNVTSSKVGNVTIQAVAKVTYKEGSSNNGTTKGDQQYDVVKYYTGTQIFAVGTESVGDVVVMSVGSSSIVVNDAVKAIDAAPMIQNSRTFVPFRALAEAFGATVAYDETTQAVTAELNGTTVVMTIGSATYTVNGAEKTADVAPFISGSRTMVPVRFAAEAFGIKVIPTYDENGATADILFNL